MKHDKHRTLKLILTDLALIIVGLLVFSLFHHVMPRSGGDAKMSIVDVDPTTHSDTAMATQTPTADATATNGGQTAEPTPTPTPAPGDFSLAFPGDFSTEGSMLSYDGGQLKVSIKKYSEENLTYFIADVWCKNISCFKTAFAKDQYGKGIYQSIPKMARNNSAVIAVSGDFYGFRDNSIVIRNGKLYRDIPNGYDICVLYVNGVMETYSSAEFNIDSAIERGAYQAWTFGPQLLKNGKPMLSEEFVSQVSVHLSNPRNAIGYYEPGHYCFITVDGRQPGYSDGITLEALSQKFYDLGCKAAYNLDGGETAMMVFDGERVNIPCNDGRSCSDIIYFYDPIQ